MDVNNNIKGKYIGISISGSENIGEKGFGKEHLNAAMIHIARRLLRLGANLAYGGDLRLGGFTRTLFDLARSEHENYGAGGDDTKSTWTRRLTNYLAWHIYENITSDEKARLINICRFVEISPQDTGFPGDIKEEIKKNSSFKNYLFARCLTRMREIMQEGKPSYTDLDGKESVLKGIDARIIMGGQLDKYSGLMPGLPEEALYAVEKGAPIYLLGGFGGAAEAVAESILKGETHKKLKDALLKDRVKKWHDFFDKHPGIDHPDELFQRLKNFFEESRKKKDLGIILHNGLSHEENERLLQTGDLKEISHYLERGLRNVFPRIP